MTAATGGSGPAPRPPADADATPSSRRTARPWRLAQGWEALHLALAHIWSDDLLVEPAASDPILAARITQAIYTLIDDRGQPVRGRHHTGAQP